jgi:hypothetical protein
MARRSSWGLCRWAASARVEGVSPTFAQRPFISFSSALHPASRFSTRYGSGGKDVRPSVNEDAQMTSTFRNGRFIAARTAAFAALLILAACGGGGGSGPTYTIGGSISGLTGSGLVLRASPGNTVSVSKAGAFTFPTLARCRCKLRRHGGESTCKPEPDLHRQQRHRNGVGRRR